MSKKKNPFGIPKKLPVTKQWGVFPFDCSNIYADTDCVKWYKHRHHAEKLADKLSKQRPDVQRGFVARSKIITNP